MMACCIIAAYIYARLVAALRRWCIFWGLVRRGPYESAVPTLFDVLRGRGGRPSVSTVVLSLALVGTAGSLALGNGHDAHRDTAGDGVPHVSELIARLRP